MGCVFSVQNNDDPRLFASGKQGTQTADERGLHLRPWPTPSRRKNSAFADRGLQSGQGVNSPVDALLQGACPGELAVWDEKGLRHALEHAAQPVVVLTVPSLAPAGVDADPASVPLETLLCTTATPSAFETRVDDCTAGHQTFRLSFGGEKPNLVLSTEQGLTSLSCVLANAAALQALGLDDEPAVLGFLARSFQADRGLVSLFQDAVKRLLAGHLTTAKHFVPGDFGRDRYFLSMRISPFAFRASDRPPPSTSSRRDGNGAPTGFGDANILTTGGGGSGGRAGGGGDGATGSIFPAMLLELDVPYEGKELAARLQRDYMILSNIPSMVTIFDMNGHVLHQNRSSVGYMGYLVGLGLSRRQHQQQQEQQQQHQHAGRGEPVTRHLNSTVDISAATSPLPFRQHQSSPQTPTAEAGDPAGAVASGMWEGLGSEPSALHRLFEQEPMRLAEVMGAIQDGREWRGLIRMPRTLIPGHSTPSDDDEPDPDEEAELAEEEAPLLPSQPPPPPHPTEELAYEEDACPPAASTGGCGLHGPLAQVREEEGTGSAGGAGDSTAHVDVRLVAAAVVVPMRKSSCLRQGRAASGVSMPIPMSTPSLRSLPSAEPVLLSGEQPVRAAALAAAATPRVSTAAAAAAAVAAAAASRHPPGTEPGVQPRSVSLLPPQPTPCPAGIAVQRSALSVGRPSLLLAPLPEHSRQTAGSSVASVPSSPSLGPSLAPSLNPSRTSRRSQERSLSSSSVLQQLRASVRQNQQVVQAKKQQQQQQQQHQPQLKLAAAATGSLSGRSLASLMRAEGSRGLASLMTSEKGCGLEGQFTRSLMSSRSAGLACGPPHLGEQSLESALSPEEGVAAAQAAQRLRSSDNGAMGSAATAAAVAVDGAEGVGAGEEETPGCGPQRSPTMAAVAGASDSATGTEGSQSSNSATPTHIPTPTPTTTTTATATTPERCHLPPGLPERGSGGDATLNIPSTTTTGVRPTPVTGNGPALPAPPQREVSPQAGGAPAGAVNKPGGVAAWAPGSVQPLLATSSGSNAALNTIADITTSTTGTKNTKNSTRAGRSVSSGDSKSGSRAGCPDPHDGFTFTMVSTTKSAREESTGTLVRSPNRSILIETAREAEEEGEEEEFTLAAAATAALAMSREGTASGTVPGTGPAGMSVLMIAGADSRAAAGTKSSSSIDGARGLVECFSTSASRRPVDSLAAAPHRLTDTASSRAPVVHDRSGAVIVDVTETGETTAGQREQLPDVTAALAEVLNDSTTRNHSNRTAASRQSEAGTNDNRPSTTAGSNHEPSNEELESEEQEQEGVGFEPDPNDDDGSVGCDSHRSGSVVLVTQGAVLTAVTGAVAGSATAGTSGGCGRSASDQAASSLTLQLRRAATTATASDRSGISGAAPQQPSTNLSAVLEAWYEEFPSLPLQLQQQKLQQQQQGQQHQQQQPDQQQSLEVRPEEGRSAGDLRSIRRREKAKEAGGKDRREGISSAVARAEVGIVLGAASDGESDCGGGGGGGGRRGRLQDGPSTRPRSRQASRQLSSLTDDTAGVKSVAASVTAAVFAGLQPVGTGSQPPPGDVTLTVAPPHVSGGAPLAHPSGTAPRVPPAPPGAASIASSLARHFQRFAGAFASAPVPAGGNGRSGGGAAAASPVPAYVAAALDSNGASNGRHSRGSPGDVSWSQRGLLLLRTSSFMWRGGSVDPTSAVPRRGSMERPTRESLDRTESTASTVRQFGRWRLAFASSTGRSNNTASTQTGAVGYNGVSGTAATSGGADSKLLLETAGGATSGRTTGHGSAVSFSPISTTSRRGFSAPAVRPNEAAANNTLSPKSPIATIAAAAMLADRDGDVSSSQSGGGGALGGLSSTAFAPPLTSSTRGDGTFAGRPGSHVPCSGTGMPLYGPQPPTRATTEVGYPGADADVMLTPHGSTFCADSAAAVAVAAAAARGMPGCGPPARGSSNYIQHLQHLQGAAGGSRLGRTVSDLTLSAVTQPRSKIPAKVRVQGESGRAFAVPRSYHPMEAGSAGSSAPLSAPGAAGLLSSRMSGRRLAAAGGSRGGGISPSPDWLLQGGSSTHSVTSAYIRSPLASSSQYGSSHLSHAAPSQALPHVTSAAALACHSHSNAGQQRSLDPRTRLRAMLRSLLLTSSPAGDSSGTGGAGTGRGGGGGGGGSPPKKSSGWTHHTTPNNSRRGSLTVAGRPPSYGGRHPAPLSLLDNTPGLDSALSQLHGGGLNPALSLQQYGGGSGLLGSPVGSVSAAIRGSHIGLSYSSFSMRAGSGPATGAYESVGMLGDGTAGSMGVSNSRMAGRGGGGDGGGMELGGSCSGNDPRVRWHEVHVKPCSDPMSGERVLLLIQTDVSNQIRAEEVLARVLEAEQRLLADIFPRHVVRHMTASVNENAERQRKGLQLLRHIQDPAALATSHECITVLFSDIKGFTEMCKEVPPASVMTFLNDLYTRFDSLTDVYGVYKVETIGDCYMVAGGLMARDEGGFGQAVRRREDADPLHATRVVSFAKAMLHEAAKVRLPSTGKRVQMRIGIHSGPATSGVVGQKMPRFCLFGDTVNTASRMESTGRPGCIHVSSSTRALLRAGEEEMGWVCTGGVEVKGKGRMDTFLWTPQSEGATRQRRDMKQRAMLLGTLHNLHDAMAGAASAAAAAEEAEAAAEVAATTASTTTTGSGVGGRPQLQLHVPVFNPNVNSRRSLDADGSSSRSPTCPQIAAPMGSVGDDRPPNSGMSGWQSRPPFQAGLEWTRSWDRSELAEGRSLSSAGARA